MAEIVFAECNTKVPVVEIEIDNDKCYAILDTGSESSVFDKEYVKNHKKSFKIELTQKMITLVGVKESDFIPVIKASSVAIICGKSCEITGMLVDIAHLSKNLSVKPMAILGCDVLTQVGAVLDYKQRKLII